MGLRRRLRAAVVDFLLRVAPPHPATERDLAREDWPIQPGGKGLRFTERLRDALRRRWLRIGR